VDSRGCRAAARCGRWIKFEGTATVQIGVFGVLVGTSPDPAFMALAHVAQGIGEVLTFAIGVAISPVPIIAVILMLFSGRAKVNGPMFLAG
jgi:hypothetical protein